MEDKKTYVMILMTNDKLYEWYFSESDHNIEYEFNKWKKALNSILEKSIYLEILEHFSALERKTFWN